MRSFFILAGGVTLFDFFTKFWIRHYFYLGQEKKILPFFSLTHIENTGIAFGLFPGKNWLFVVVGLLMTLFLIAMAYKEIKQHPFTGYALALILGGAWGNLWDRIHRGAVTDFLDFYWRTSHWPAFNIADSAICVGAATLLIYSFKGNS